jgi:hypothetical protein
MQKRTPPHHIGSKRPLERNFVWALCSSGRTGDTHRAEGPPSSLYEGLWFNNQNKKPHGLTWGFEQQSAVGIGILVSPSDSNSAALSMVRSDH